MSDPHPDRDRTEIILHPGAHVFGRYRLAEIVGEGGMGVVWRAHDEKLERDVALKFLPDQVRRDPEALRDLKRETRRCLDLTHPNIVRVYDFVEDRFAAAIAMEYVPGRSLSAMKAAAEGGCLAAVQLAPLVEQLCAALDYAHGKAKLVHRDLKPANLLVTAEGELKVADFGIARSLVETQTRLTGTSQSTSGTLVFMSPQQLGGDRPTVADDIYALGATLYDLLTGKPPFFRGDGYSLMIQIRDRAPAPLAEHRDDAGCEGPEIPAAWSEALLACLAKEAAQRPTSAGEVWARLRAQESLLTQVVPLAPMLVPNVVVAVPSSSEWPEVEQLEPTPSAADHTWLPVRFETTPPGASALMRQVSNRDPNFRDDETRSIQSTPFEQAFLPGSYEVSFALDGFVSATRRFQIPMASPCSVSVVLDKIVLAVVPRVLPVDLVEHPHTIPELGLVMMPIPTGSFVMGSNNGGPDEKPLTRVTITHPFWIGKTQVTQREWRVVTGGKSATIADDDHPAACVSWGDAVRFCQMLTKRERAAHRLPDGYGYGLPTEAQWEYACRSGTNGDYAGEVDMMAWYERNSVGTTHPVAKKGANAWGLHDMHGNVWEWCAGWFAAYRGGSASDFVGDTISPFRSCRGGSWRNRSAFCRSATRYGIVADFRGDDTGFRIVLTLE